MQSRTGAVARLLLVDLAGSVLWFPLWWYTTGLSRVIMHGLRVLRYRARSYSLAIWLKNFFVPMYGQHDLVGRLVSVVMRFIVLVGRSIALLVEAMFYLFVVALWAAAPAAFLFLCVNGLIRAAVIPPLHRPLT